MPILTDSEEGRKRQGKSSDGKMREVRDAMKAARNHGGTHQNESAGSVKSLPDSLMDLSWRCAGAVAPPEQGALPPGVR
jgi:hypothetical protein